MRRDVRTTADDQCWTEDPEYIWISGKRFDRYFCPLELVQGISMFALYPLLGFGKLPLWEVILGTAVGLVLLRLGVLYLQRVLIHFGQGTYRVYNPLLGWFGKGETHSCLLSGVGAIEISRWGKLRWGESQVHLCYDVFLVLKNGDRVHVFVAGTHAKADKLARELASRLSLPLLS